MLSVSIGRRPVIITNGSVIWTLALLTDLRSCHSRRSEIARTLPKTSQRRLENGPKGAKKGRRGPPERPKTGPRRARGGPGGLQDDPSASIPTLGGSPGRLPELTGPVRGCFGVRFGSQVGPRIVQNRPRSALKKGIEICVPKKTPGEPESQLTEASARPPAKLKSFKSYVFYDVFEVSSLCA